MLKNVMADNWDSVWEREESSAFKGEAIGKKIMASDILQRKPGFCLLMRHIWKLGLPRMESMLEDITADNWDSAWECAEFSDYRTNLRVRHS